MGGAAPPHGGLPGAAGLRAGRMATQRGRRPDPAAADGLGRPGGEIDAVLVTLSDEQRVEPRFFPDNYEAWTDFFRRWYKRELAAYDGPPPPPARNNAAGRHRW
ncbi:hypothetical protein QYE76_048134 [Lolium multiflorum]|uniref:Uncharacterized protein n=1 Tax=Lolium multiflorum TaxID=4521 RepID=A0AAD8PRQ2_LOLMU|nr:hypothetical protein QYE76_048134 [Lolium multiflorum]